MKKARLLFKRTCTVLLACMIVFFAAGTKPEEVRASELETGTYQISGSLSAYLSAMGGVEFGGPLLSGVYFVIDSSGNEYLKLTFTKSSVTIYSITCDTFVDANPTDTANTRGVANGTMGIYDSSGNLVNCTSYTLSSDTALNSADEEVNYVDSITYPIDTRSETYNLAIYINSNVMGVEFCNANSAASETTYAATLTVDWSNVDALEAAAAAGDEETTSEETTAAETTTEETETESPEADDSYDGLSIYEADSENTDESEETLHEESSEASEDSASFVNPAVIIIIIIAVIIVAAAIIIIAVLNKKKKSAPMPGTQTEP